MDLAASGLYGGAALAVLALRDRFGLSERFESDAGNSLRLGEIGVKLVLVGSGETVSPPGLMSVSSESGSTNVEIGLGIIGRCKWPLDGRLDPKCVFTGNSESWSCSDDGGASLSGVADEAILLPPLDLRRTPRCLLGLLRRDVVTCSDECGSQKSEC